MPSTPSDKKIFFVLLLNFILIVAFGVVTSFFNERWYVGFSMAFWILLFELTWVLFTKYRETNYSFTFSVALMTVGIMMIFSSWVTIYCLFVIKKTEDFSEDKDFHMSLVTFVGLAYLLVLFLGLITGEYRAKSGLPDKSYSFSFKIIGSIVFFMAVAVGVMGILFGGSVFFGVFWLSSILYLCF